MRPIDFESDVQIMAMLACCGFRVVLACERILSSVKIAPEAVIFAEGWKNGFRVCIKHHITTHMRPARIKAHSHQVSRVPQPRTVEEEETMRINYNKN
jgi:hypothetical protein